MAKKFRYSPSLIGELWPYGVAAAIAVFLSYLAWPERLDAEMAVRSAGNSDVTIGEWRWFGCSRGDAIGWDFTATNALGQPVQGVACCGAMKACTVRF